MVDFRIVICFLSTFSSKEHFSNSLSTNCCHKFTAIIKGAIIEDALNKQCVAYVESLIFGCVPKKIPVLLYYLFA